MIEKKLLIGLVISIFLVFGTIGYVILQPWEDTSAILGNTSNLIPEAALQEDDAHKTLNTREKCSACKGSGWSDQIVCPKCGGDGLLDCTACNGTGKDSNGNICPICHGTGQIICPECKGTGGAKCKFCGGDGYYDPEKGDKKAT